MQRLIIVSLLAFVVAEQAFATITIRQFNDSIDAAKYDIDLDEGTITILDSDQYTFMFEAYDDQTNQPADIELIQIDAGVAGLVKISVIGDDSYDRVYGAREVKEIQMQTAGSDAWLAEILIAEDLGRNGPVVADHLGIQGGWGIFNVGSLSYNTVEVADSSLPQLTIRGDCVGLNLGSTTTTSITIEGDLLGDVNAYCPDDISITGAGPHTGNINLSSICAYDANIYITGNMNGDMYLGSSLEGDVAITGDMNGSLQLDYTLRGTVEIGGSLNNAIMIGADLGNASGTGSISISGDIPAGAEIDIGDGLSGELYVGGNVAGDILVGNQVGDYALLEIDGRLDGYIYTGSHMRGTIELNGTTGSQGLVDIRGDVNGGTIDVNQFHGEVLIPGSVYNYGRITAQYLGMASNLVIERGLSPTALLDVATDACGEINMCTDPNYGSMRGKLHIHGDLEGKINVQRGLGLPNDVGGKIYVDGSMHNGPLGGDEIVINGSLVEDSAIAIDYDGWDELDTWQSGATVKLGTTIYYGNTPSERIWEISSCRGDMNNDWAVDPNDEAVFTLALTDPNNYATEYPGLEGSRVWHGDADCSGQFDADDQDEFDYLVLLTCCTPDYEEKICPEDIDRDGYVGLADLATLLAAYGMCEGEEGYNPDADLDGDGCVGMSDLSQLLASYPGDCECPGQTMPMMGQQLSVSVEPYDTNGYNGGGFAGESDHFVFDIVIETADLYDDWTSNGAMVEAANGALFRLAPQPTKPRPYATFVCAPSTLDIENFPNGSDAAIAGAYLPSGPEQVFATDLLNVVWYDEAESDDGPAAVMRLVIDVSGVAGADTSGGFGSVYFSQSGPVEAGDIKVADLYSATGSRLSGDLTTELDGAFYVFGQR